MIIDDDLDIIDSLNMVLEANDHEVVAKTYIQNVVEEVQVANPDIIILDIMFPDDAQAGFKAARLLNKDESINRIPILMLSAVNSRSDLAFSFTEKDISNDFMPVGGFVEKPVEPAQLLEKIQQLLGS